MRITNKDRDIFADMMISAKDKVYAYGNIYAVYIVGTNCIDMDVSDGLIITTYNIVKADGRGCTESTYAVLEMPVVDWAQPIVFIAGKWAYLDRWESDVSRVWE